MTTEIGDHTYYGVGFSVLDFNWSGASNLTIGRYCSIAERVTIFLAGNHRQDWVTTFPLHIKYKLDSPKVEECQATKGDVVIENDVWIGHDATIMSGVKIRSGAVIGTHAVVTRNVQPYTIIAGNPARLVGQRFSYNQVADLLEIAWWDWTYDKVIENADLLCSPDIDEFIRRHRVNR